MGLAPAVEVKADVGGSTALTWGWGWGMKSQVPPEGALVWQLGGGLGPEGADPAFSLHFRSPMSLPSTSIPPTRSAQVSIKPTCICPGRREGRSLGFVFFSYPLHSCLLIMTDGEELEAGVRWSWMQGQLLPFPGCVTSEGSLYLSGPLPPHLPQGV